MHFDNTRLDSGELSPAVEQAVLAANRGVRPVMLTCKVEQDAATAYAARVFDMPFTGTSIVKLSPPPDVPPA